ncbi:MAG: TolC family protein [Proteobacteria bacterium]|nr:TolC family protein [Pseudomonadota bacterium]
MKRRLCVVAFTAALLGTTSIFGIQGQASAQSLQEEVAQLLVNHPQIRAARQNVASSEEGENAAFAEYLPRISAFSDFGYERIDSPGRTTATPGQGPFTTGQARQTSVTLTQTVFNGYLNEANNANANLAKQSAEISLEEVEQGVLFEGVSIYLEVLRNIRLRQLATENTATIQRQFELEDERVRRGAGITLDVLEAKKRLQVAKERIVAFDGALRDSRSRFNQVFGHEPTTSEMVMPTTPLGLIPENVDTAIASALVEHPAIRKAEKRVDIAQEQRTIAKAEFYPTVDIVAEWSYEDDLAATRGSRRNYTAKVQANWDLFNGFATRAGVARASHDYLSSINSGNFVKRKISEETRLAWSGLDTARQRVTLLQNAVNIAAEVFSGRSKLRKAGKETVINVLDAESQMFDARIQLVAAQHDARIAVYRLLAAMGQVNVDTISQLASIKTQQKLASAALQQNDSANKIIEPVAATTRDEKAGGEEISDSAAAAKMAAVEPSAGTEEPIQASQPVTEMAAKPEPTVKSAENKTAAIEPAVKSEVNQPEAVSQAKTEIITQPEQTAAKAEMVAEKTIAVSAPKQTSVKTAAVTPTKKPETVAAKVGTSSDTEANPASKPADKSQTLASVSESSVRQANYPVDGDSNFIRAWPFE